MVHEREPRIMYWLIGIGVLKRLNPNLGGPTMWMVIYLCFFAASCYGNTHVGKARVRVLDRSGRLSKWGMNERQLSVL